MSVSSCVCCYFLLWSLHINLLSGLHLELVQSLAGAGDDRLIRIVGTRHDVASPCLFVLLDWESEHIFAPGRFYMCSNFCAFRTFRPLLKSETGRIGSCTYFGGGVPAAAALPERKNCAAGSVFGWEGFKQGRAAGARTGKRRSGARAGGRNRQIPFL